MGQGSGNLAIHYEPRCEQFIEPARYSAAGLLALLRNNLPALDGDAAELCFSPVPTEWLAAAEKVRAMFWGAGFAPKFDGRTLELQARGVPSKLLTRAALVCFVLDPFTRSFMNQKLLNEVASCVGIEFGYADSLLALLDIDHGANRLSRLLGTYVEKSGDRTREEDVEAALRRLGTRKVVQFDCGGGRFLQHQREDFVCSHRHRIVRPHVVGVAPSRLTTRARTKSPPCFACSGKSKRCLPARTGRQRKNRWVPCCSVQRTI